MRVWSRTAVRGAAAGTALVFALSLLALSLPAVAAPHHGRAAVHARHAPLRHLAHRRHYPLAPPVAYAAPPPYAQPSFFFEPPDPYGRAAASDAERYGFSGTRGRIGLGADSRHPEGPGNIAIPSVR